MNEQALAQRTNRREMLKLSGMGMLAGVAANALTPAKAHAAAEAVDVVYASWIHGNSMEIEYPDRIASQRHIGYYFEIEGKPGLTNWFHFAIPTPVLVNDARLRIKKVMLRFTTASVDAFVRDVHVYDGEKRIAVFDEVYLSGDNWFAEFVLPDRPEVRWGLGISLGVGFGVEMMDHHMHFISAGCDFTLQEPEPVEV
ncbi:MAG: DUF6623 family protein [Phycisphaerales bacterium]